MKGRFTTLDILAIIPELRKRLVGQRVQQVYDINSKTYLIRFSKSKEDGKVEEEELSKTVLLLESGIRIHITEYNWSKNMTPSAFTMKMRKHLNNKRLESIEQLGVDRIIDLKFGAGEFCYHVIIELYDKGNIVITDNDYIVLNVLRPRKAGVDDDVKFMVRERYPVHMAQKASDIKLPTIEDIQDIMSKAKPGDNLRKIFTPKVIFGPALLEHSFIEAGLPENAKIKNMNHDDYIKILSAIENASGVMRNIGQDANGFIIQQMEERVVKEELDSNAEAVVSFLEFHPMLFNQHKSSPKTTFVELESFNKAVDTFFSSIESQKIDRKALQAEKEAVKKLENVKKDHERRLKELSELQEADKRKAGLIEMNSENVDKALLVIRSAVANQMSWESIKELVDEAQKRGDPVASLIVKLSLEHSRFTMCLRDPYDSEATAENVEIDLELSSFANARKYYTMKRHAQKKEQKTVESSSKALKSAEIKTKQALKEVAIKTSITKARKVLWFEKFFWFISSDKYLVIAGRDAQQNELIVKKHLNPGDVYVHAEVHGASSVVVKNSDPSSPIPPKTLEEAGTLAVCFSSAWEAKVVPRAWYVFHNQVSKTAPTGEYLTVGSFMIRGKKNYLPLTQLILGFGFLFRLDEESVQRRASEEQVSSYVESGNAESEEPLESNDIELSCSESEDECQQNVAQKSEVSKMELEIGDDETGESLILKPKAARIRIQQKVKNDKNKQIKKLQQEVANIQMGNPNKIKRGQKGKLKKLKEKYKDQDEEERELRMAILGSIPAKKKERLPDLSEAIKNVKLASQGQPVEDKQSGERTQDDTEEVALKADKNETDSTQVDFAEKVDNFKADVKEKVVNEGDESDGKDEGKDDEEDDEEDAGMKPNENRSIIKTLTAQPRPEDNLLYTIPVVGPYSALANFKYKVKLLPGMNKRGKAAKTALNYFINDKSCTQREKDLLKSSKDQDVARNIPNKVKVAAQNLNAVKRKK